MKKIKVLSVDPGSRRVGYALVTLDPKKRRVEGVEFGTLYTTPEEEAKTRLRALVDEADWVVLEEARTRTNKHRAKRRNERELRRSLEETLRWYNRVLEWARAGGREILLMPGFAGNPFEATGYYQTWKEAFLGNPVPRDEEMIRAVEETYGIPLLPQKEMVGEELRRKLVRELIDPAEALAMAALAIRDEIARGRVEFKAAAGVAA